MVLYNFHFVDFVKSLRFVVKSITIPFGYPTYVVLHFFKTKNTDLTFVP